MSNLKSGTNNGIRVRMSPWFKLKKNPGHDYMAVDLKQGFGFLPEKIIIERDHSRNNVIRVNAVLTDEEAKKEDKEIKEHEKRLKKLLKKKEVKEDGKQKQKPAPEEKSD